MSDTPITDAEEARQIAEYEKSRECGDPPFAADFDFARKMERRLNKLQAEVDYARTVKTFGSDVRISNPLDTRGTEEGS